MQVWRVSVVAAALLASTAPALAQLGSDSYQFIEAVEKRDGNKATELLRDHPLVVNTRDSKGDTALIVVIRRGDPDWTGLLLNKGGDIEGEGAGGDTPLIAAARIGFDDAAEWLLGLGAKPDSTNRMGETPLIIAVQQRDLRLTKLLLDLGADPDKTDAAAGYSARDYAARDTRSRDILKLIERKKPKPTAVAR